MDHLSIRTLQFRGWISTEVIVEVVVFGHRSSSWLVTGESKFWSCCCSDAQSVLPQAIGQPVAFSIYLSLWLFCSTFMAALDSVYSDFVHITITLSDYVRWRGRRYAFSVVPEHPEEWPFPPSRFRWLCWNSSKDIQHLLVLFVPQPVYYSKS